MEKRERQVEKFFTSLYKSHSVGDMVQCISQDCSFSVATGRLLKGKSDFEQFFRDYLKRFKSTEFTYTRSLPESHLPDGSMDVIFRLTETFLDGQIEVKEGTYHIEFEQPRSHALIMVHSYPINLLRVTFNDE
jgi:hypothetical protein